MFKHTVLYGCEMRVMSEHLKSSLKTRQRKIQWAIVE